MSYNYYSNLSPREYKIIFDHLDLPWRDYKIREDGWINMQDVEHHSYPLSVNVLHGGYKSYEAEDKDKGNVVSLVEHVLSVGAKFAMDEIDTLIGRKRKNNHPDLEEGYQFANDFLPSPNEDNGNYFVRLPTAILKSTLSASAKLVWAAIYSRCGKGQIYSFAGKARISDDTGLSKSTVGRSLKELKEFGALRERIRGDGPSRNRYPICSNKFINP